MKNSYHRFQFFFFDLRPNMTESQKPGICDEDLFNEVFRKNARTLYKYLYHKFGPDKHPEDLVQEAFLKLWQNCHKVPFDKARSFLFTVAGNTMLNVLARKKTAENYLSLPLNTQNIETPHYVLEEKEYMGKLQEAIAQLSEEQRITFMLNRVEGMKHQEIAEMLGVSRKTVEKRIYTALDKLRKHLGDL